MISATTRFILLAAAASRCLGAPIAAAPPLQGSSPGNWSTLTCTSPGATDAATDPALRWGELDVAAAWNAVALSWNNDPPKAGDNPLPFPEMVSNFFNGPEQWNCQDIGDVPCSTTIECTQTNHPAGWFILNSFSRVHQIHQEINTAIGEAESDMQGNMGTFASTFAPQAPADTTIEIVKALLDLLSLGAGLASAYAWNIVISQIITDSNPRGAFKDSSNTAIAFIINEIKDNLPAAKTQINEQNDLTSVLTTYFNTWESAQSSYVNSIFSGSATTLSELDDLISNGKFNTNSGTPNLDALKGQVETIMYAQMIPTAWAHNPVTQYPFILQTSDPCASTAGPTTTGFMTDDTAAQSHVCWNGNTYYVLNANWRPESTCYRDYCGPPNYQLTELPGGTFNTLSGGKFGGVRLDDMVISSVSGWQLNGNKNGYQIPDASDILDGAGNTGDIFQAGIQTPGFFSLPVCTESQFSDLIDKISGNQGSPSGNYWPCG